MDIPKQTILIKIHFSAELSFESGSTFEVYPLARPRLFQPITAHATNIVPIGEKEIPPDGGYRVAEIFWHEGTMCHKQKHRPLGSRYYNSESATI